MTMAASAPTHAPHVFPEVRQRLADPGMDESSPGEEFAQAASYDGGVDDVSVPFRAYLPASFPLFAERPRYTVRHLLKKATIREGVAPFVYEEQPSDEHRDGSGVTYDKSLEAAFTPVLENACMTEVSVDVPIPDGILGHPRLLAAFIDYRVLVRAGTRENEILLHGEGPIDGLLSLEGARTMRRTGRAVDHLMAAAAFVEETGGSCDGIVAHNAVYWQALEMGLLSKFSEVGVRIARTRMIPEDKVLLGDFRAAATLMDPGGSSLTLRRGGAANGQDVIEARARVGLAVHLPQHFVMVDTSPAGAR